ncbi:MAG: lipoyl(octanoyl) transferase LipB [Rhodothermales bacterium]
MSQPAIACHLGRIAYEPAWALQRAVQQRLVAAKRSEPAEPLPHVLLVVEHPPVFTLGKSGDRANLLADDAGLARRGATFVPVDRGGDITYHGPGQLVVYPLLDLDRLRYADGQSGTDIHRYLRELEEAVRLTCADYGLAAGRVDGRTGVWIGPDAGPDGRAERKVCAMGIRCSRWVTMHGLALNLNTDLSYFDLIVPCGIADRGVTSLAAELGRPVDEAEATERLLGHLAARFGLALTLYRGDAADNFLDTFRVGTPSPDV